MREPLTIEKILKDSQKQELDQKLKDQRKPKKKNDEKPLTETKSQSTPK